MLMSDVINAFFPMLMHVSVPTDSSPVVTAFPAPYLPMTRDSGLLSSLALFTYLVVSACDSQCAPKSLASRMRQKVGLFSGRDFISRQETTMR